MSELERQKREIDALLKGTLEINPGLESVMRHKAYGKTESHLAGAFKKQVRNVLDSDLFDAIDRAIGAIQKDERIDSESDYLEVYDAVRKYLNPPDDKTAQILADFLILVFNMGGQDFLNKQNIPATFELTNEGIIVSIKGAPARIFQGTDETTSKWIGDQIISGRAAGLSNAEIKARILDAVPDMTDARAARIIRTETSNMVGTAENETARRNGASHKIWVTVGSSACPICQGNEDQGQIGIDSSFLSGDDTEPAHPNCMCVVEYFFTPFMGSVWSGQ